jgi:hypothetical protein
MIVVTWFRDLDHKRAAPLECERLHVITVTLFGARLRRQSALAQCFFSSRRETRKILCAISAAAVLRLSRITQENGTQSH